jgi:hypothetical protein
VRHDMHARAACTGLSPQPAWAALTCGNVVFKQPPGRFRAPGSG